MSAELLPMESLLNRTAPGALHPHTHHQHHYTHQHSPHPASAAGGSGHPGVVMPPRPASANSVTQAAWRAYGSPSARGVSRPPAAPGFSHANANGAQLFSSVNR